MPKTVTMADISKAQRIAAKKTKRAWWFGPDEMAFFSSQIESEAFTHRNFTTCYFVTSEQCVFSDGTKEPRMYTVRSWDPRDPARIETHDKFQQYATKEEAIEAAKALVIEQYRGY
jgi:hypothetical protein